MSTVSLLNREQLPPHLTVVFAPALLSRQAALPEIPAARPEERLLGRHITRLAAGAVARGSEIPEGALANFFRKVAAAEGLPGEFGFALSPDLERRVASIARYFQQWYRSIGLEAPLNEVLPFTYDQSYSPAAGTSHASLRTLGIQTEWYNRAAGFPTCDPIIAHEMAHALSGHRYELNFEGEMTAFADTVVAHTGCGLRYLDYRKEAGGAELNTIFEEIASSAHEYRCARHNGVPRTPDRRTVTIATHPWGETAAAFLSELEAAAEPVESRWPPVVSRSSGSNTLDIIGIGYGNLSLRYSVHLHAFRTLAAEMYPELSPKRARWQFNADVTEGQARGSMKKITPRLIAAFGKEGTDFLQRLSLSGDSVREGNVSTHTLKLALFAEAHRLPQSERRGFRERVING